MKCFRINSFGSLDALNMRIEDEPKPSRREVLVKVRACSLNYRDLSMLFGKGTLSPRKGLIPLSDGAGEIVETGDDVSRFRKGDRVAGIFFPNWQAGALTQDTGRGAWGLEDDGWLTQYKVISEEALVSIPQHLSFEEASTLPCAAVTAWNSLMKPRQLKAGQTVLIQGTGGVSLFALQFAKLLGVKVIALTSTQEKEQLLREQGADHIINYTQHSDWYHQVRELTEGRGVDRIVEVGGPGTIAHSIKSCTQGGEIILLGFASEGNSMLNFMDIYASGAVLMPMSVGSREDFEDMNRAISQAQLRPLISRTFTFADTVEAWRFMQGKKHTGKIVITLQ